MLYELTIPQFSKMLRNMNHLLGKGIEYAQTKKFEPEVLMEARLAPDQFNLTRQIQISCDTAKLCASRLTGKEAPVHADTEKTMAELRSRIDQVVAYLNSFSAADYKDSAKKQVTQTRWEGKYLLGDEFVLQHAIPNFYFHISTAYSILRHNGVEIGKKDYLGEMPYRK